MSRIAHTSPRATAVGPYSHAAEIDGLVFLSGQTPMIPGGTDLLDGDVTAQTRQVFANLDGVLEAAGLGRDDVVKCTVFLTDMADFAAMNAVYAEVFSPPFPARSTIGVAALPLGARVEIELVAVRPRTG